MTYLEAISSAPEGADFIAYTNHVGAIVVIQRRSDGVWDGIANASTLGYDLIAAGVAARRKSLWNADTRQFISSTAAQMMEG